MALLDVSGLTIAFPGSEPVRDLSFTVAHGETVSRLSASPAPASR